MSDKKKIIDLGCGTGVSTLALGKALPQSEIYGLDFSRSEIRIAKKIKKHYDVQNVHYEIVDITELNKNKKLNRKLSSVDGVVLVALLGYIENPLSVVEDMAKRMKKGSKIYFVEYDYRTQLFTKPWLSNEAWIKQMFKSVGIKVTIEKKKFLFWDYICIYGIKEKT